jgi:hypothetical protein
MTLSFHPSPAWPPLHPLVAIPWRRIAHTGAVWFTFAVLFAYAAGGHVRRCVDSLRSAPIITAAPDFSGYTVLQLRTIARQRLGSAARIGGRRISAARRDDLINAIVGA